MDARHTLAAASRDGHLALRRVERHHRILELLGHGGTLTARVLADRVGVSTRTVERDVERLRDAGVPFTTRPGRGGGIALAPARRTAVVELDAGEIAALVSAMAVVGTTSSPSAGSATAKLVTALR
ncbi:helix-turn-helix transcriptional regulator [Cellulomonas wangsupingiae]|uniref:HTH domain-containing protein n=1 Tax=Cellulomonas wangsupingiae TaxID=2968085 RepID=A0ABY5K670_9CELL|nr:HTH domain-containing protein [Cellulomonas wangsupingiae]MCC2335408.1 HTH domain-containing protein [Cellulomonas wangsupingiae]MCM0640060.1 HTH domain-containing protein [Cellulomonas wangsupingiae]UUI64416.1 HTH domain-containing protein [Cellulomonas wangsupingiae]